MEIELEISIRVKQLKDYTDLELKVWIYLTRRLYHPFIIETNTINPNLLYLHVADNLLVYVILDMTNSKSLIKKINSDLNEFKLDNNGIRKQRKRSKPRGRPRRKSTKSSRSK